MTSSILKLGSDARSLVKILLATTPFHDIIDLETRF